MPLRIIRQDITKIKADAIVTTAHPKPIVGMGVDRAVHNAAGERLYQEREKLGRLSFGDVKITPAFELDAKYVIHAVTPIWQNGENGEEEILRSCYRKALRLALDNNCKSLAFPLLSAGNHGFPKQLALQTAVSEITEFVLYNDMQVTLAVFGEASFDLTQQLIGDVASYIDEKYIEEKRIEEYGFADKKLVRKAQIESFFDESPVLFSAPCCNAPSYEEECCAASAETFDCCEASGAWREFDTAPQYSPQRSIDELLLETDAGFSETLLRLIDESGKKDTEVYKKANIDRKLFSKIRSNPAYRPSKITALAFAIALELNLEQTKDLISRAGYALTHSSKFDIIIEYFIINQNYDLFAINNVLIEYDQPLICV